MERVEWTDGKGTVRKHAFGRNKPKPFVRRAMFQDFLIGAAPLPAPPPACDYRSKAMAELRDINKNADLGICVPAAGYHCLGTWTGNAGVCFVGTDDQVVADYSAIGGYDPKDPTTDQGCDENTAFSYWTTHGFADGSVLAGVLAIDPTNPTFVQQAVYLFETAFICMGLPNAWVRSLPTADGFIWDSAGNPNPSNGHAVMATGYTPAGLTIDTWALFGTLTWRAIARYAAPSNGGSLNLLISEAMLDKATRKAPSGLDWTALSNYFLAMGGVVKPTPQPTPVPVPVPPGPVPVPPGPVPVPTPVPPPEPAPAPVPPAPVTVVNLSATVSAQLSDGTVWSGTVPAIPPAKVGHV